MLKDNKIKYKNKLRYQDMSNIILKNYKLRHKEYQKCNKIMKKNINNKKYKQTI